MGPNQRGLVGAKWSSSRNFRNDQDDEILILLENDKSLAGTARKNWMQMDKDLKRGMHQAVRERDGCQSSPQTPKSFRRIAGVTFSSPSNQASKSPLMKSGVDRWGENPRNTTRKTPMQAPMSWHAGGKEKWKASPELSHKTIPVFPLSPVHSSSSMSQQQKRQGNGTNDSTTKRSFTSLSDVSPEFNKSMSSLAPQLPKRFSSNGSFTSVDVKNVVRGHRVYKIEPTSRNCHFDHLLPSKSGSDRDLKPHIEKSKTELVSSSHHPLTIPEDSRKESVSLDSLVEEEVDAASSTNDGLNAQNFSEDLLTGPSREDANDRPTANNLSDLEKHSLPDVELFEYEVLHDKNKIFASEEGADRTETKDLDLQPVDVSGVKVMVVDKVPGKKRWSSKNIENFPIWPPVVRVIKFEKRKSSCGSDGSAFSDDLTASEGDFLSSLGDDELSAGAEMALLLPEQQTSYRIRYDGPTNLANLNEIYGLPPVPVHDDRFEPLSGPSDLMPHVPTRTTFSDTVPKVPRRGSSMEDLDDASLSSEQVVEMRSRPDVWITPLDGDTVENAVWKVKRVWAVDQVDEKEEVHSVHNIDLFSKIKTLVGAPDRPSYASSSVGGNKGKVVEEEIPSRSWHVLSVVERNGKVNSLEAEREFAEDEFRESLHHMAEEAVKEIDINKKAVEEAKRRIMMLKNSDPSKTPRHAPKMLRRNLNEAISASEGSRLCKDHTLLEASRTDESNQENGNDTSTRSDEAHTIDMSYLKATQDRADPPSSPSAENGSSAHDASAENNTICDTGMSKKKKKKRQKSTPKDKKSSSTSPPKKKSPRNPILSPQTKDGSFDIPPSPPQLLSPTAPTTIKKKRKKKKKAKENEKTAAKGGGRSLRSPEIRRICAYDMVALSDTDTEPVEESIEHKTNLESSPPKSSSPGKSIAVYSTPKREKIRAAAMVHDSDSEDDSVSETTKQKLKPDSNLDALKESRKNGLSWWQVSEQNASSGKPSIEPWTVSSKRRGGKRTTALA